MAPLNEVEAVVRTLRFAEAAGSRPARACAPPPRGSDLEPARFGRSSPNDRGAFLTNSCAPVRVDVQIVAAGHAAAQRALKGRLLPLAFCGWLPCQPAGLPQSYSAMPAIDVRAAQVSAFDEAANGTLDIVISTGLWRAKPSRCGASASCSPSRWITGSPGETSFIGVICAPKRFSHKPI